MEKPKTEKLLFLISKNIGRRVLSVRKNKIPTEYREKGTRCLKDQIFQMYHFFLIDCQSYTFLVMNIIFSDIFI